VIIAAKNFLQAQMASLGISKVYFEVAGKSEHRVFPWASILTPLNQAAEELARTDKVLRNQYLEDEDYWLRVVEVFSRRINLEVTFADRDAAKADQLLTTFLANLPDRMIVDPSKSAGWAASRNDNLGEAHFEARIQVLGAVWSDKEAHIRDAAMAEARVRIDGSIVKVEHIDTMGQVLIGVWFGDVPIGGDQDTTDTDFVPPAQFILGGVTNYFGFYHLGDDEAVVTAESEADGYSAGSLQDYDPLVHWRSEGTSAWIKADLGSTFSTVLEDMALLDHNLGSTAAVTLQGNDTDDWAAPPYAVAVIPTQHNLVASISGSYRWWRLVMSDPGNQDGRLEASLWHLGQVKTKA